MKIGYIASHLFRHTFEINEVTELVAQRPQTRVYSFYRPTGEAIQSRRLRDIPAEIVCWSPATVVKGLFALAIRHPLRLTRAAVELGFRSLPNPVYWFKNAAVFLIAMPVLEDARRHGITHLHANFGSSPATVAWLGKRILGTGMSVTFHAFDIYLTRRSHRDPLRRRKLRDADLVVAVHRDGLDRLMGLVPDVPREKFHVIRISVVLRAPNGERPPGADASVSTARRTPLFVAAGNLIPKKGFDVLLRAAGILAREGADFRVRILGEGPERRNLEAISEAEGIEDRVELPGFYHHAEFAGHLEEALALVMPSRITAGGQRDGIPTVVVEAWLARTPVVASTVGGMSEVVIDGKTAVVFEPGDASALADGMRAVLQSHELRRAVVAGGLETAVAEFSPRKNVGELLERIESIGAKPEMPPAA
jgi:colanic acid/amylovoran biosynthesis glycosyltransferase